jgi:hypothetical protein
MIQINGEDFETGKRDIYIALRELYYHKNPRIMERLLVELSKAMRNEYTFSITHDTKVVDHSFLIRAIQNEKTKISFVLEANGLTNLLDVLQETILSAYDRLGRFDKIQDILDS